MTEKEPLIPRHGGYRKLKSFQVAQLVYDVTVRFCEFYVDRFSRTKDQMVQAVRSGVQNIAEGSQASATSRKTEMKLTKVARASLEELRLDFEDFLRQRGLPMLPPNHEVLARFKEKRCANLQDVQSWVAEEKKKLDRQGQTRTYTGKGITKRSVSVGKSQCMYLSSSALAANAALSLLNIIASYLLDRQLAAQAEQFLKEGGFTERLFRIRTSYRRDNK